jgi:hypothetical protein
MLALGALLFMIFAGANTAPAFASQHPSLTCSGASLQTPGIIQPGTYHSLAVQGVCVIPGGSVDVDQNVVVNPGGVLVANFPASPGVPEGDAEVTVGGNLLVGSGATLVLGCAPSAGCVNTTHDSIRGNLVADNPLGVLVHGDIVGGNVVHTSGGGGVTCIPSGFFADVGSPDFSAYEDSTIGGNIVVTGVNSCWLGLARLTVAGNAILANNNLADPDAIEILSNVISHNLICEGNSMVWNSGETTPDLFPRTPAPNTVDGKRIGQCVLASPTTPGGPTGPGPF